MNMAAIEEEVLALTPEQQDRISALLVSLRLKRDGLFEGISNRLNDGDEENWVSWDELKPELEDDSRDSG